MDGGYEFLGDFRYFAVENPDLAEKPLTVELLRQYPIEQASYDEHRDAFRESGWQPGREPLGQFKDQPWAGNWAVGPSPPANFVVDTDHYSYANLKRRDGAALVFVGSAAGWNFRNGGAQTKCCSGSTRSTTSPSRPLTGPELSAPVNAEAGGEG